MNFFPECTSLSQSSINLYNTRIHKWLHLTSHKNILRLLAFPKVSYDILITGITENTPTNRHMYLSAICAIFNHSPTITIDLPKHDFATPWKQLLHDNSAPIREQRQNNMPTETQQKKEGASLTLSDICVKRDSLSDSSIDKLLIGFYTYIPCIRADLFATAIISPGETTTCPNFIVLSDKSASLTITDFKSKPIYHKIEHPILPTALFNLLSASLKATPRSFLFTNCHGGAFTRTSFSNWSSRRLSLAFKGRVTLTIIRHIYVSSIDFNMPSAELEKISKLMGHSIITQKKYQWKDRAIEWSDDEKRDIVLAIDAIAIKMGRSSNDIVRMYTSLA